MRGILWLLVATGSLGEELPGQNLPQVGRLVQGPCSHVIPVQQVAAWLPAGAPQASRQPYAALTPESAAAGLEEGKGKDPPPPPFAVQIAVGRPWQTLQVILDTTAVVTWLVDMGSRSAQEGELGSMLLYRQLGSTTVKSARESELRPRETIHLGVAWPGKDVTGRMVEDNVRLAGAEIMGQPLLLAERLHKTVFSWGAAGVLGLSNGVGVAPNLVGTWQSGYRSGPSGPAESPIEAELFAKNPGRFSPSPRCQGVEPTITLWPEAAPREPTRGALQAKRGPDSASVRLGLGPLHTVSWSPLADSPLGWATNGHVAVGDGKNESERWAARLIVDSTLHGLGVPFQSLRGLLDALLPHGIREELCWWHTGVAPGLQVQCDCSVAEASRDLLIQVAGLNLALSSRDLFHFGDVCTASIWALRADEWDGNMDDWRLGEPFLKRHAVTLDVMGSRLGFEPEQPFGLVRPGMDPRADPPMAPTPSEEVLNADADVRDVGDGELRPRGGGLRQLVLRLPGAAFGLLLSLALLWLLSGGWGRLRKRAASGRARPGALSELQEGLSGAWGRLRGSQREWLRFGVPRPQDPEDVEFAWLQASDSL